MPFFHIFLKIGSQNTRVLFSYFQGFHSARSADGIATLKDLIAKIKRVSHAGLVPFHRPIWGYHFAKLQIQKSIKLWQYYRRTHGNDIVELMGNTSAR